MTTGVLLMAYGSPGSRGDVEPYLRDIRGGRPIRPGSVEELSARYERAGLPSPLLDITRRQADGVRRALGGGYVVEIGMKHWEPRIAEAVRALADAGVHRVIGIALAPHFSAISIGGYEQRVRAAMSQLDVSYSFEMVPHWYEAPGFITLVARNVRAQLDGFDGARVFFTAHSLPERIIAEGDPYRDQLLESAKLIAEAARADDWQFAFQSASTTGEPWLGPDVLDALREFAATGGERAVIAPIGFIADHLEVLYDVDVECVEEAARLGVRLRRIASPNDDPLLTGTLASIVRAREAA